MTCDVGEMAEGEDFYFCFFCLHDSCLVEGSEVSQPVPDGRNGRMAERAEEAQGAEGKTQLLAALAERMIFLVAKAKYMHAFHTPA